MKNIYFLLKCGLLFVITIPVLAQTKTVAQCQSAKAPTLRGFYIGQTVKEINEIIPNFATMFYNTKEKAGYFPLSGVSDDSVEEGKEIGLVWMSSNGFEEDEKLLLPEEYEDVDFSWYFFNDKLYAFSVHYNEYEPSTSQSFVKQLIEKAKFPAKGWLIPNEFYATLKCSDFKIWVGIPYRGNAANVNIADTNIEAEIKRKDKAIKQRKIDEERERIRRERLKKETLKP